MPPDLRQTGYTVGALYQKNAHGPEIVFIPGVIHIFAGGLSRLEYDRCINSRTINVHVNNKVLAKVMHPYVGDTSDYHIAMQAYDSTVPFGTTTTVHASHGEYKYNHALVTDVFEAEKPVYVNNTSRQQEIVSRQYLSTNTTAEKEDEVHPVTAKEVAEAQRAHKHQVR